MGVRGPGRIAFLGGPPGSKVAGCHGTSYPISNKAINAATTYTSGDLRDGTHVALNAVGIWLMIFGTPALAADWLFIDSADDTPDGYSSRVLGPGADQIGHNCVPVRLGTGANAGKIKIKAAARNWSAVYGWPVGYWT